MIILTELTVKGFVEELGSSSPAPGGGSVAALAAGIGAALSGMVFNLTIGKKAFLELDSDVQAEMPRLVTEAAGCQKRLLELVDKDTDAFMLLMAAYKLPKDSEPEKACRAEKIQEAYRQAIAVPLEVATTATQLYDCVLTACRYGNRNAISDAGVAALSVQTAVEGALFNVMINLPGITDTSYRESVQQKCAELAARSRRKQQEALAIVHQEIGIKW